MGMTEKCSKFDRGPNFQVYNLKLELSEDLTIAPLLSFFGRVRKTMTGNNPKLDLFNVDAHKKTGQILSICSQGIWEGGGGV